MNGALTLEKLEQVGRWLKAMPPVARQIWFVDRTAQYYKALLYCKQQDEPRADAAVLPWSVGLLMFDVRSADYDDATMPHCAQTPGIWAIMSDGTQRKIHETNI